jgi:DNA repair exonuclease SbcCD ATPase subunit
MKNDIEDVENEKIIDSELEMIEKNEERFDPEMVELKSELRAFMKALRSYQTIMETQGNQIKNIMEIVDEIKKDRTNPSEALTELNVKYIDLNKKIDDKFEEMKTMMCSNDIRGYCHDKYNREGIIKKWLSKYGGHALTTIIGALTMAFLIWLREVIFKRIP